MQTEVERECEDPRSRERHDGDEKVEPDVVPAHRRVERQEQQEEEQGLGVSDLEHRRDRSGGEEHHRPHRRPRADALTQQSVQREAGEVTGHERQQESAHPPRAEHEPDRLGGESEHRHERPGVLCDLTGLGEGKRRRISLFGDEPVPLRIPPDDEVGEPRLCPEPRQRRRQRRRRDHHRGRHSARREVDQGDPQRQRCGRPPTGRGQRELSHARSPRSTASICASGTRSSS